MNPRLYLLGRIDLIKRLEKAEALLTLAVNETYAWEFGTRSTWRAEAILYLHPERVCDDDRPGTYCTPDAHYVGCRYAHKP